jgi:hypothetical protein
LEHKICALLIACLFDAAKVFQIQYLLFQTVPNLLRNLPKVTKKVFQTVAKCFALKVKSAVNEIVSTVSPFDFKTRLYIFWNSSARQKTLKNKGPAYRPVLFKLNKLTDQN